MVKTKVRYTKTRAVISIDKDKYKSLCDGYNKLRRAINMMMETNDLYLSDIRNLDDLQHEMHFLGFERGENYWNDATIPKEKSK